jgi:hypothetical protein
MVPAAALPPVPSSVLRGFKQFQGPGYYWKIRGDLKNMLIKKKYTDLNQNHT